jgi:transposase
MERRTSLKLTAADRRTLEKLIARPSAPAGHVRRARVVLLSADGVQGKEIAKRVGITPEYVSPIRKRFESSGVDGLAERKRAGRKDHAVPAETIERIIQTALSPPPAGRARWTTRLLGRKFKLTSWTISKILRANELKPHLVRTYKVSRDPAFTAKVTDVVGLYLNPPDNAIVLSVDEKTSIQDWSARSCRCRCGRDGQRGIRTTTSGTGSWICTRR